MTMRKRKQTAIRAPRKVCQEQITLEDLVAAITEEAAKVLQDEKDTSRVVSYVLADLLSRESKDPKTWH
jgi:phage gp16-like protein